MPEGGTEGSVVVGETTVYYVVSGRTISFYADAAHTTPLVVSFCVKASNEAFDGLEGSTHTTPEHNISNFIIWEVVTPPEDDETVTVIKDLVGDTAGTFDLTINGTAHASGVGDGGTTGAVVTAEGSVTVSEAGAGGTELADYTSSIICKLGQETVAQGAGTSLQFTLGDNEDVICTITNTLNGGEPDTGDLKVVKYLCEGTNDPQVVFVPLEEGTELPNLEDCVEGDATFSINGGPDLSTTEGVLLVNDLPVGNHELAETSPNQASTTFTIVKDTETVIYVLNYEEQPDQGEIQIDKFFCDTEGEDRVEFEVRGPIAPQTVEPEDTCTVGAGVTFVVTPVDPAGDAFEVTTEANGTIRFPVDVGSYSVTEKSTGESSEVFVVEEGELTVVIVKNFEGEAEETPGSVTINKELDCDVCETFTPGYYFNGQEQTPGFEDATRLLEENGPIVIGEWTFATVQDVLDQAEPGSLLRHTLALQLNVWLAQEGECDLASLMFTSDGNEFDAMTVGQILSAALEILESNDPELAESGSGGFGDLHEAIDLINNNHGADDGVLSCDATSGGAGFMFELYDAEDMLVDSGTTGTDGSLVLDGIPDGTGLPLGTYTLVEVGNDADLECRIVSVGPGATLNMDGTVTVVLTVDTPDVTITVVNDCEEGEFPTPSLFSVSCPPGAASGPSQIQIEAAVLEGLRLFLDGEEEEFDGNGVLEVEPGTYDWVITEADGETELASGTVDVTECGITVNPPPPGGGTPNEGEQPTSGGQQPTSGGEGTLGGNPLPNTSTSPIPTGSLPAALVALLMLAGLGAAGYAVRTEVARRR